MLVEVVETAMRADLIAIAGAIGTAVAVAAPTVSVVSSVVSIGLGIAEATADIPQPPVTPPAPFVDPNSEEARLRRESLRRGRASTINPVVTGASELLAESDSSSAGATTLGG